MRLSPARSAICWTCTSEPGSDVGEHPDGGVEDVLAARLVVAVPAQLSPVGLARHGVSVSVTARQRPRPGRSLGVRRPRRLPRPLSRVVEQGGDGLLGARLVGADEAGRAALGPADDVEPRADPPAVVVDRRPLRARSRRDDAGPRRGCCRRPGVRRSPGRRRAPRPPGASKRSTMRGRPGSGRRPARSASSRARTSVPAGGVALEQHVDVVEPGQPDQLGRGERRGLGAASPEDDHLVGADPAGRCSSRAMSSATLPRPRPPHDRRPARRSAAGGPACSGWPLDQPSQGGGADTTPGRSAPGTPSGGRTLAPGRQHDRVVLALSSSSRRHVRGRPRRPSR